MTAHTASPITTGSAQHPVCLTCTSTARVTVYATDPVTHVEECHPEAVNAVRAQFAPRHQKIVRTAH